MAKKFNTPALNLKSAKLISNKKKFLRKFNKKLFLKKSDLIKKKRIHFPVLTKDDKFSGAEGVTLIRNKYELLRKSSTNKDLIYEKYVKGSHLIVTGLVINSNIIFKKIIHKEINKDFTTKKLAYPNKLSKNIKKKINNFVTEKLKIIKFNHGPFTFEIFYKKNDIYCAEIEPSIPGSFINEQILKKCFNINLVDLIFKYHFKRNLYFQNRSLGKINIEFFYRKLKFKELILKKKYNGYKLKLKKINEPDKKNKKKCLYILTSFKKNNDKNL